MLGQPIIFPHWEVTQTVEQMARSRVLLEQRDGPEGILDWQEYSDLAMMDALNMYQLGHKDQAVKAFQRAMLKFDETDGGFRDKAYDALGAYPDVPCRSGSLYRRDNTRTDGQGRSGAPQRVAVESGGVGWLLDLLLPGRNAESWGGREHRDYLLCADGIERLVAPLRSLTTLPRRLYGPVGQSRNVATSRRDCRSRLGVIPSEPLTSLLSPGTVVQSHAQQIANHELPRPTKLYDRTNDAISLDEIERILNSLDF